MVVNATFNNISVISQWSVLLVEETGVPRENHLPTASHIRLADKLYNIKLYRVHLGIRTIIVVIGTDCTGTGQLKIHTIRIKDGPPLNKRQRIPKKQSKKDNPEKLETQGTQDKENKTKTQHNRSWTPLYANKHK